MQTPEQIEAEKQEAEQYIKRQEVLSKDRINFQTYWQECMDYIVPRKNDVISQKLGGEQRNLDLFDTTAIYSNQLLASALHGMLTNPATRFFELMVGDPKLDQDDAVKGYLEQAADLMFIVMNNSNFQTEIHEIYIDLGAIGTACMFMGEHKTNLVHFNARAMKEIWTDENNLGLIDTVHREFSWKPKQIMEEFGADKVPQIIQEKFKQNSDESFKILHAVHPVDVKEKGIFPFRSVYILKEHKLFLSKDGFREFPYAIPRWTKTSGEKYGRGPGMDMLPDIRMVNKMMETTLKGAQKTVDPPLMVSDDGVIGRVRLTPGGLTIVRPMSGDVPIKPLITDARIDFGVKMVEDVRSRIRSGFFVDQLQLNEGPQMTATEVQQRVEEKLRLMGPVLGRQHFEFLRPVIERVFGIMTRAGKLPDPPAILKGKKIDVRYSSLVARAQRMSEGQNLSRAMSVAAPLINADPKAMDLVDTDAGVKYIFDVYGVPQKLLRNPRDLKNLRDARAKAQAKVAQQADEQHQASVAGQVMPGAAQLQQAQNQAGKAPAPGGGR